MNRGELVDGRLLCLNPQSATRWNEFTPASLTKEVQQKDSCVTRCFSILNRDEKLPKEMRGDVKIDSFRKDLNKTKICFDTF